MSHFLIIVFLFFMGCVGGWVLELLFRRGVHGKWVNPGFLVGPYLPLYGTGLVLMFWLCDLLSGVAGGSGVLHYVLVILILMVAMTALEYVTGLIFIKGMKVKLWDYSKRPGNIQGIICPLFTLLWGGVGAAYYLFLHPAVMRSLYWLADNLAFSFVIGLFFGIFLIDVVYSFRLVTRIRGWADENQVVVHYENLKTSIRDEIKETQKKYDFLFPFKSARSMLEELEDYWRSYLK